MSRIISDLQKKEVFKAIPAQLTIGETTVTASKIWSNQKLTSYPAVTLNISQDGIPALQMSWTVFLYYQAILTLTETTQGIPGVILAEALAGQIVSAVETWIDLLAENVLIFYYRSSNP
ncbi:hypothetical protein MSHOH_1594 [Methanosarcina horonobensis HB-1 = JCM 15518]|uniref:Uncharacterized protein n=1 Tax=Methanosarcina horonobensis HB-1 = JCM 15518 TaxID=1434110 RepID=A0A0E3SDA9_9EURY|nr:hypothetical protein [Methanosarcina horonobensis]AKB78077.1 hypothetical protein MSHOH_1594 [Methanosarcina horonobensis HB-1 = JCM 15518]